MEKINIAELLKLCPKGMELDCTIFNEVVKFDGIDEDSSLYPIRVKIKDNTEWFDKYGCFSSRTYAKCVIFPKGKTTWEGFVPPCEFKDGDIIYVKDKYKQEWCTIIKNPEDGKLYTYVDLCINSNSLYYDKPNVMCYCKDIMKYRLATEEEKEKLFKAIKDNGYKWNPETKILEKLVEPKFKVGDVIQDIDTYKVKITEVNIEDECYGYESMIAKGIGSITFSEQDEYELVLNKFDINTLVPFESKVLVRNANNKVWRPTIFGCYMKDKYEPFYVLGGTGWKQCIPYEGNRHLLGKTDDCNEYFKTWK